MQRGRVAGVGMNGRFDVGFQLGAIRVRMGRVGAELPCKFRLTCLTPTREFG